MAFLDRAVGIDLGTTNSEIAWLPPSERELVIYADRFGRRTVPSAVAWDDQAGAFVVGHAARQKRGSSQSPVESIKRKMGQRTRVRVGPHDLSPEEVSAKILAELKTRMQEVLKPLRSGEATIDLSVTRAVITVPAYFDAPQVEATRRAGELAGFQVIGILQEPTAAAIYHTWRRRLGDGNFLVYDLGGGTFDVSILRCVGGEYQVLAIDGDNYLGGDDLDRRYAEHLRVELCAKGYALDLDVRGDEEDRRRFLRIVHLAQEIKESLSTSEVVHVAKSDVVVDKNGESVTFEADVGRADWERVVGDLVETTITCAERALARSAEVASVGIGDIDHVVLVGGSTRTPVVMRRVGEALCARSKSPRPLQDDVDTCVALGAAVHAAQRGGFRFGDSAKRAVVCTRSALVSSEPRVRLAVDVEQAPEQATELAVVEGERVLAAGAIAVGAAEPLRLDLQLDREGEHVLSLVIRDPSGAAHASLPLSLWRGDVRPRASGLSQPSVVAKDIALEVVRAGRRERKVLIPRGTGLPTKAEQRFFTADQSGAVVLRILQGRLPIKTLVVEVPTGLAVGTPVDVALSCDDAMRLEAKAEVAGRELWAKIEPPEHERADSGAEIDALLEDADRTAKSLWGADAHVFRREADRLSAGIREVAGTDPDKLAVLAYRLQLLLEEFRGGVGDELSPPAHRFEDLLDSLRRVVFRASGLLLGLDRASWETRIAELDQRSRQAFDARDAVLWRRAYNEAQALYETAIQEEFSQTKLDDPAYLSRWLQSVQGHAGRLERALGDFVAAADDEVRALQLAERDRLAIDLGRVVAQQLDPIANDDPGAKELRQRLDRIGAELHRIEAALARIPSLGLVAERGA